MYLGVEKSLSNRRWLGPALAIERDALALHQHSDLPLPLCYVLARLGVAPTEVADFLNPTLRVNMSDPLSLKDCAKAAQILLTAIQNQQKIAIFADYDVDGGTSAALLIDFLRQNAIEPTLYVPDRITEGYGPNVKAMAALADRHDLILCVDCGTLAHEALEAARAADVVVLDHHLGAETLPEARAVVNPNRQDETGDLAHLCAAAVVFMLLTQVARLMRAQGQTPPNLINMLDLVALATVADVAPLVGVNRAFVRQGLKVMGQRQRVGLNALSDAAGLNAAPSAYHLGYVLGPRINAGGRIGTADLGARLLACSNPHEASAMAEKLEELNTERRSVEAMVRLAALEQAEARGLDLPLAWAAQEGWHPGVVGIVAARLKEKTNRPAVVIGFDGDSGKGSGRSVSGIDLGAAIHKLAREGLITAGGGHKMAAGLSLNRAQLEPAMERLGQLLDAQGAGALGPADLKIDGTLMPGGATVELIEQLEQAGPFGAGASAPRFAFPDCTIAFAKPVGDSHLKITLSDGFGTKLDAICFGAFDGPLGPALTAAQGGKMHVAGRLEINSWGGRSRPQLRIEDASPA
ncbi:MAG: single-stranded-DNA-specific exonuclease RecJ [Planktomarina sp.]|uniref:single-stranded-DNA-specific exonuclease RecJ n=1 Tax=Planktomarina sp. TaxID=2024851 RepID=UPI0032612CD8|nr:single-stranded-DNA-specific exonuclease RecJ [Planktomarina sp.]